MTASLEHRGPDDSGVWLDGESGIAIGHRRLSVLELSPAGDQPMLSVSGRYVVAFNGEIYNHLELRSELESGGARLKWRGHSDTETLLAAFDEWGIEKTLSECVGMFSIALWDRQERTLILARDRLGEKPLYYGWQRNTFLFGSELKALRAHESFSAEIDVNVVAQYFDRGYINAPYSIYTNIFKVVPGTLVRVTKKTTPGTSIKAHTFWSLDEVARRGLDQPIDCGYGELIDELDERMRRAVLQQSIADVPIGAFLSGGIDSSTVVAMMQDQSSRPIKTFTIGFQEAEFNEAEQARAVAKHLGTDHTEFTVTHRDAIDVIPRLSSMFDEPFGDSSAIPTFLVSKLSRQQVTVSLSGDGGDELFGGYARYGRTNAAWRKLHRIPSYIRGPSAGVLRMLSRRLQRSRVAWKAGRLAHYMSAQDAAEFYNVQMSQTYNVHDLVFGSSKIDDRQDFVHSRGTFCDLMMFQDSVNYLPGDILTKVDRSSMSVGLECRVPMLDHRIVEFAWRVPMDLKIRNGNGKWLLQQVLHRYVPASIADRPKMGFSIPVGSWTRGPLREWAESLVSIHLVRQQGILNPDLVHDEWVQHLQGTSGSSEGIWRLLMFQEWLATAHSNPTSGVQ
jgi:asparagine synthase (glutamine-hydrolysing)